MANETSVFTRARRVSLCQITSGAIATLAPITHIALGDAGVDTQGEPIVPNEAQTALNHEVGRYAIEPVEYPVDTTARYQIIVPENELGGIKISEIGLLDADGVLCAVKNTYIKQKDNDVTFTFVLDDEF